MKILFIHQNFPGQFVHLAADLAARPGYQVVALTLAAHRAPAGVTLRRYRMLRGAEATTHPLLRDQEQHVLHAEACAAAAFQLKQEGFVPDIVLAHPGWGEALFIKDVFPQARLVIYCEYYYAAEGQDVGFDPEQAPLTFAQRCRLRLKNTTNLLSLEAADGAISPTQWQKSTYPAWARDKISVIHDGIDLARLRHDPGASLTLDAGGGRALTFAPGAELLSYVARNLEPVRGFQMLMRTLPEVLRRRPGAHAIVVGGDDISYGQAPPDGVTWRSRLLAEVGPGLDLSRVHFVGQLPYPAYKTLLDVSRVHAYWTTPFVLSWSFLEARASGLPVVASATAPVLEFAQRLGVRTAPFFERDQFADALIDALAADGPRGAPPDMRAFDVARCVAAQTDWLLSF